MIGFYEGCFLCTFRKEGLSPEKCFECSQPTIIRQDWIYSFGLYFPKFRKEYKSSKWSQAIVQVKRSRLPIISSLGRIMTYYLFKYLNGLKPCLITNVPASSIDTDDCLFPGLTSFTTKLLLSSVSEQIKDRQWAIAEELLVQTREKPTKQHCCKSDSERKRNVSRVYTLSQPNLVKGRNIILLDDVVTSGATLTECARVLYEAGAKNLVALTIARTSRKK
ncbi:MAG: ComF family protein [Candidatus Omnitrophica bacterium]|nr:ComF family protein [Candidatus Omnitrophota bacterium]